MRFIVTQKIFSFADSFIIHDENQRPVYKVEGRLFSFGNKLTIYNMSGGEAVYIEQKLFKFLPEYHLHRQGIRLAIIKKEFTFMKPRFNIQSQLGNYKVEGDFFNYNFDIRKGRDVVARVNKKFFAMRDTYGIDIADGEDAELLLAMCIVIDQVLHDNNHNNN